MDAGFVTTTACALARHIAIAHLTTAHEIYENTKEIGGVLLRPAGEGRTYASEPYPSRCAS